MEEKLVSRLTRTERAARFASSPAVNGWREETWTSEPRSDLACASIPLCTLALSEWIATSAATPETMARAKMASRRRCVLLSRQAIRHVHGWKSAAHRPLGSARPSLKRGMFFFLDDRSAAHFHDAPR